MNKDTDFIGIDISKLTFDVWSKLLGHKQFSNNKEGFVAFRTFLNGNSWCCMEYTGVYYHQLALYLYEHKIVLSVLNPLVVKRFIQMKQQDNKTDKSDAKMIALYGEDQPIIPWVPFPKSLVLCKDIYTTIGLYIRQSTAFKNKLKGLEDKGMKGKLLTSLKRQIRVINKEIDLLEEELESIIKDSMPDLLSNIKSITGIGRKTAAILIVASNGFQGFSSSKKLISFWGMNPIEISSGTSIRKRSKISKRGNPAVRNKLFMCSFTACKYNPQCKNLYDRIIAKGKSPKLALIAVANKLIKQAYAIAMSGIPYDPMYKSTLTQA